MTGSGGRWRAMVVVAVAVLASACSQVVSGSPQADPSAAPRLKTGNYPTTAQEVPAAARPGDAYQQEGWRIADAVIFVSDVDRRFSRRVTPAWPVISTKMLVPKNLPHFTDVQATALGGYNLLTGFIDNRGDTGATTGLWGSAGVLRFRDAGSADRALTAITPAGAKPVDTTSTFPGSRVVAVRTETVGAGRELISLVMLRGDLWVVAAVVLPTAKEASEVAAKMLRAQYDRTADYKPLPLDTPSQYPMDQDAMMTLVFPGPKNAALLEFGLSADGGLLRGYRTARAEAHLWGSEEKRHTLLLADGPQLVASNGDESLSRVTRFDTAANAQAFLTAQFPISNTASPIEGIDKDAVYCASIERTGTMCTVRRGRYLHETFSTTAEKAYQQTAAAYLVLSSAPQ